MKKFYNNTLIGGVFSKALRVIALLCVLLGVSSSAWGADDGFFDGLKLGYFPGSGSDIWTGYNTTNIGELTGTPYLKGIDVKTWNSSVTSVSLEIKEGNTTLGTFSSNNPKSQWEDNGRQNWNKEWSMTGNIALPNSSGSHTISVVKKTNWGTTETNTFTYTISGGGGGQSGVTINSGDYIYMINFKPTNWSDCWRTGTGTAWVTLGGNNYELILCEGTANSEGAIYKAQITTGGTFSTIKFGRGASVGSAWNTSGEITLESGKNCATGWTENGTSATWSLVNSCGGSSGDDDDTGDCTTLYLEPTGNWAKDGARFAAYFYGGGTTDTWIDMKSCSSCNGLFMVGAPNTAWTNVIFCRMNGGTTDNKWDNRWDQTGNLSRQTTSNLYTITNKPDGQNWTGYWSTTNCTDKAPCQGGGDDDDDDDDTEDCNYIEIWARGKGSYTDIYCNVGDATATSTGIKSYNGNNYATWTVTTKSPIAVSFCAGDNHGYCTNTSTMQPGNRYYCEFAAEGWGSQNYTITLEEPLECAGQQTEVLLSKQATVNKSAGTAKLYGYITTTNCNAVTDYGFYYCRVIDGEKCKPTASSTKLQVEPSHALVRGEEFEAELALEDGFTYYYRAYAVINSATVLSQETRMIGTDPCVQQACCGAPVVYTINADPAFKENMCKLHFKSLQDAIDHLKASSFRTDAYQYAEKVGESYNLKQPVVMNVVYYDDTPLDNTSAYIYRGTTDVGKRAGDAVPKNSNLIQDINRTATNAANTLTIKAGTKTAKPWIHHIVLRNSKNIVLDSLCVYSDPVLYDGKTIGDNALEMDINHADGSANWHELNTRTGEGIDAGQHFFSNANILVQNCMIGSDGFTGAHISSYDGVTFKNNDFEIVAGEGTDTDYGASFKLLYCKNVKFIENNFRGDHATLMWIQEVQNMLVMNNVFWNTNKFVVGAGKQYPAAMRLATQFSNPIKNVGFFYNTYYFAENDVTSSVSGYDFLQMTHTRDGGNGDINISTIKFQYNNCYSYDKDAPGRSADPFLSTDISSNKNFCPNNFWSQYDEDKGYNPSKFAFGCTDNEFTNVKNQVCETTASGPASLMVKGEALNNGVKPDIEFTGITLTDEEWYSDRYLTAVRPRDDEGWTYGAYQSKGEIKTNTIYWVGTSDKWDDRNNWEYETRDASGKMIRQRVSCINTLSEDLKVVIEEIGTVEVAGGRKWPKVPASFNANDRKTESGVPTGEQVSAGNSGKFASTIELEYGAGLRGVERLKDSEGNVLYNNAIVHFDADRDKWLLVGSIVKPLDSKTGEYRTGVSGDYYLEHLPQVYMHQAKKADDGNTITWDKTFADLNIPVPSNEVYAINVTSMYGTSWMPADIYNYFNKTNYKGDAPHPYTFTGRFAVAEDNVAGSPYAYTVESGKNLLNNVYPCNLNAKEIESLGLGTINVYDYEQGSFVSTSATQATGNVYIKAQNGFVFIPEGGRTQLELTNEILAEGSTRTRAAEMALPTFSLKIDNANTTKPGASNIVIRYDEFLGTSEESVLNTPKVFTKNADTPEAYIMHNDGQYARLDTGAEKVTIPLGIRLQKGMNITFEKVYNEGYDEVTLVDTKTRKFYNLLQRNYTTDVIGEGDTEGRFYLNLSIAEDENIENEGDVEDDEIVDDDNISTEVEETIEEVEINIYSVDNSIVRVSSVGTSLKHIYVSDMTGRTEAYNVEGNYVELQLPVASGVYTITAIGETASKTGKVILK